MPAKPKDAKPAPIERTRHPRPKQPPAPKIVVSLTEKLMLTMSEAQAILGVSHRKMYELVLQPLATTHRPLLFSVKQGKRRMVPRRALEGYVDTLMRDAG